ncbi:MAG: methylenetetrahydrofolate reductase [NAD(P)H] [Candidatus Omnitrophota bacterium]|jgi:methylenetetrahydrofolate reductase (NADPH)
MKISECYRNQKYTFSFEFFPPKTAEGEAKLFEAVGQLKGLSPSFVSVTYGAMGTTRSNTVRIVDTIKNTIGLETAAHLTCVGHNRSEILGLLSEFRAKNIDNIVALRGDPPKDAPEYAPPRDGFRYASELVAFIRAQGELGRSFSLAVGGYPEGHPECRDLVKDLEHLKRKVDAGSDAIVTQLFFSNKVYTDFVARARKAGIRVPIVPGIMPVTHGPQIQRFALMCGASIPAEIQNAIERFGDNQASVEAFGIDYATRQCEELLRQGVPGFHFYTLNKSRATMQIYRNLKLEQYRS